MNRLQKSQARSAAIMKLVHPDQFYFPVQIWKALGEKKYKRNDIYNSLASLVKQGKLAKSNDGMVSLSSKKEVSANKVERPKQMKKRNKKKLSTASVLASTVQSIAASTEKKGSANRDLIDWYESFVDEGIPKDLAKKYAREVSSHFNLKS
jgi:hypothetical protein